ncbi:MAG: carboxypeptidase-like regulatory domain-containing protein, partial [Acidobacteriota bacterium]|nr:carboxypeptidase-like regulatory domain-containing protein [Acidobacteriota bacterium]
MSVQSLLRAGLAVAGRWALGATFSVAAWWFLAPTAAVALELTGRVTDAGGSVIVGARVELQRVPSFYDRALEILDGKSDWATAATVGTSADGAYRLQVPEPGMWQVEVSAAGKIPRRCRLLPVLHDETLPDAVLKKDVGFEVRIESDEGSPLAGAQVWVRSLEDRSKSTRRPGVRAFHAWADTGRYGRTGDDGRVGLALEQGRKARIYAFATGFLPAVSADVDTRDTTLRLQRGKPVVVRLRTASGNPVTAAVVTVSPVNWVAEAPDESGEVRLFVAPDQPLKVMLREANGRIETTE